MFNDIEKKKPGNERTCLETAKRSPNMQSHSSEVIGVSVDLDRKRVWYRTCPNKPAGEWGRIARKMTQKFEEASRPIFDCAQPFLKGDIKSTKCKQTISFSEYDSNQFLFALYWRATSYASTPQCVSGLIRKNQNKEAWLREVPELSEADLENVTHRKDLTASGDRVQDSRDNKTIAHVSQEAGFSAQVGNGQFFVTRLSITNEVSWTLVCREYTLLRDNPG